MKKLKYRYKIWKQIAPFFSETGNGVEGQRGRRRGISKDTLYYGGDVLSEIIIRIITMLFPLFYSLLLEKVILQKETSYLRWVITGYILLQLLKSGTAIFQKNCQNKVNYSVYRKIRVHALDKYFHMKYETYMNLGTGDIKMTLEDAVDKLTSFQTQFYQCCMNGIFAVIMAAVLIVINWRLALIAFLAIPITFWLDHLVSRSEKNVNEILNENDASWATWLDETIKGWKEIRVNQCEKKRTMEFEEFQKIDETYFMTWLRFWVTRTLVIPKLKDEFVMQFLLYFAGGFLIYYDYITIGMLLVFVQYYGMLSERVKELSASDANLQSEMPHYERILNHLGNEENLYVDGVLSPKQYDITFENVTFGYSDTENNVIENLSFHIREGDRVGFAGGSGAGKSTILKLMLGQLAPKSGNIKYGGALLKDISKNPLYERIAYISQDAKLFQESVLENLRLGKADASMEEIEKACKRACIYDFILSLPGGFETEIGENGAMLSGGQRQRLLLAKAFLRDADLYILDEATSALDCQVEEEIVDTLKCIPKDKTVIVVAHREQVLDMCDYVVELS